MKQQKWTKNKTKIALLSIVPAVTIPTAALTAIYSIDKTSNNNDAFTRTSLREEEIDVAIDNEMNHLLSQWKEKATMVYDQKTLDSVKDTVKAELKGNRQLTIDRKQIKRTVRRELMIAVTLLEERIRDIVNKAHRDNMIKEIDSLFETYEAKWDAASQLEISTLAEGAQMPEFWLMNEKPLKPKMDMIEITHRDQVSNAINKIEEWVEYTTERNAAITKANEALAKKKYDEYCDDWNKAFMMKKVILDQRANDMFHDLSLTWRELTPDMKLPEEKSNDFVAIERAHDVIRAWIVNAEDINAKLSKENSRIDSRYEVIKNEYDRAIKDYKRISNLFKKYENTQLLLVQDWHIMKLELINVDHNDDIYDDESRMLTITNVIDEWIERTRDQQDAVERAEFVEYTKSFKWKTLPSDYVFPEGFKTIPREMFSGITLSSKLVIPASVTTADMRAFYNADLTAGIEIPGIVNFGYESFAEAKVNSDFEISSMTEVISDRTFANTKLSSGFKFVQYLDNMSPSHSAFFNTLSKGYEWRASVLDGRLYVDKQRDIYAKLDNGQEPKGRVFRHTIEPSNK